LTRANKVGTQQRTKTPLCVIATGDRLPDAPPDTRGWRHVFDSPPGDLRVRIAQPAEDRSAAFQSAVNNLAAARHQPVRHAGNALRVPSWQMHRRRAAGRRLGADLWEGDASGRGVRKRIGCGTGSACVARQQCVPISESCGGRDPADGGNLPHGQLAIVIQAAAEEPGRALRQVTEAHSCVETLTARISAAAVFRPVARRRPALSIRIDLRRTPEHWAQDNAATIGADAAPDLCCGAGRALA
jgi:hypothetical protein